MHGDGITMASNAPCHICSFDRFMQKCSEMGYNGLVSRWTAQISKFASGVSGFIKDVKMCLQWYKLVLFLMLLNLKCNTTEMQREEITGMENQ